VIYGRCFPPEANQGTGWRYGPVVKGIYETAWGLNSEMEWTLVYEEFSTGLALGFIVFHLGLQINRIRRNR